MGLPVRGWPAGECPARRPRTRPSLTCNFAMIHLAQGGAWGTGPPAALAAPASPPARNASTRALSGRTGGLRAGYAPAALFRMPPPSSLVVVSRNDFPAGARAQRLEGCQRDVLAQEAHRAVGEGEVGPARMAAPEGTQTVVFRAVIAHELFPRNAGRHPVIDRHRRAEQALRQAASRYGKDRGPFPRLAEGIKNGIVSKG